MTALEATALEAAPPAPTYATSAPSATSELPETASSTRKTIVHDVVEYRAELERQSEEDEVLFVRSGPPDPGQELIVGQFLERNV